jgi:hypothetical protein
MRRGGRKNSILRVMDNAAQEFARKIVAELGAIRTIVHNAVNNKRQYPESSKHHQQESSHSQKQIDRFIEPIFPPQETSKRKPAVTGQGNSEKEDAERFRKLREWKPVIELVTSYSVVYLYLRKHIAVVLGTGS